MMEERKRERKAGRQAGRKGQGEGERNAKTKNHSCNITSLLYILLIPSTYLLSILSLDLSKVDVPACSFHTAFPFVITKPNTLHCLKEAYSVSPKAFPWQGRPSPAFHPPLIPLTQPRCSKCRRRVFPTHADPVLFLLQVSSGRNIFSKQCLLITIPPRLNSIFLSPDRSLRIRPALPLFLYHAPKPLKGTYSLYCNSVYTNMQKKTRRTLKVSTLSIIFTHSLASCT